MERRTHKDGCYDFLTGIPAFSSGVCAHEGFEIVRAVFEQPLPWKAGFDRVERELDAQSISHASLCSVELRCPEPYSADGFDAFNAFYVERLVAMGVFESGSDNPVGRTNVAPIGFPVAEQCVYAFSYVRPATTDRAISFVIAGGGEVRGAKIGPDTIVSYSDVSGAGMTRKATFVLDVMEKRLTGLDLSWGDVRQINVYTKHPVDGVVSGLVKDRVGSAFVHGVHRFHSAPPVEAIEFEMDVKGATWEVALS